MRESRLSSRLVVKGVRIRGINGKKTVTCCDYSMGQGRLRSGRKISRATGGCHGLPATVACVKVKDG